MTRCRCGHDRDTHLQDGLGTECTNRYCACPAWRPRPVRKQKRTPPPPVPDRDSAVYDRLEPCPSDSARRRHLAQGRTCSACGVGYEPVPARKEAA